MKLFLPQNIFTKLVEPFLPENMELIHEPSSMVVKQLELNTSGIALIPSLDLIKHQSLFVSSKYGLSFDGLLSNAFFYFTEGRQQFGDIYLRGDVSMNEMLLTKILFEERFSSNVELVLDTSVAMEKDRDYILCGDENFSKRLYEKGISFADEIAEILDFPYVNYLFASQDREALSNFEKSFSSSENEIADEKIKQQINALSLPNDVKDVINMNLESLYFDLTSNEQDGLNELVKLVYYHGIIDDMFDIKFI